MKPEHLFHTTKAFASSLSWISLSIVGLITWVVSYSIRQHLLRQKMPPGPRGIPLLGNVFQMPTELPWLRFADYTKEYGTWGAYLKTGNL